MTDQPSDPCPAPAHKPAHASRKFLGLTLLIVGLALPLLDVPGETGGWNIWEFVDLGDIFASAFLGSVVGLALYATANNKPATSAFVCVFPYLGPVLFVTATELERIFAGTSAGQLARRIAYPTFMTLAALSGAFLLFYAVTLNSFRIHNHSGYGDWLMHQEARGALKQIYEAEKAFHARHQRYGNFAEIGFGLPEKRNRYTYRIDESGRPGTIIKSSMDPPRCGRRVPLRANFSESNFTVTAWGYITSDNALHAWHINELGQGLEKPDIHGTAQYAEKSDMDCTAERR